MRSRIRQLQAFIPAGLLSQYVSTPISQAWEGGSEREAAKHQAGGDEPFVEGNQSLGTKLARQLEAWLLPQDRADGFGAMLKELRDAITEETEMSPEERKRLPLNALMLKAMHDRERLSGPGPSSASTAKASGESDYELSGGGLSPSERQTLLRAAHFSRFAAASYGVLGNFGHLTEIVAKEAGMPPPNLVVMRRKDCLQKWFVSKHTGVDIDDVRDVVTTGSVETRAYFVAVDHSTRSVVLSLRGTYSLSDSVVNLLCKPVDFACGKAHHGISQSAVSVWGAVKKQVEGLLREHDDYKLVLTGHSLGAGMAILVKILLACDDDFAWLQETNKSGDNNDDADSPARSILRLDADRPVHVECYAFAPPPVFCGAGVPEMENVISFVNGSDCVPTVSLGSLYSLFRTLHNIDKLPLDVYERAAFILDTRVRAQNSRQGLEKQESKQDIKQIASKILEIGKRASDPLFGDEDDTSSETNSEGHLEATKRGSMGTACTAGVGGVWSAISNLGRDIDRFTWDPSDDGNEQAEEATKKAGEEKNGGAWVGEDFWNAVSDLGGDIDRFTRDVSDAADRLLGVADKVGETVEILRDGVGHVADRVVVMTSDEIALTALLLKRLAEGGGPSPDEMLLMVQKCQKDAMEPEKGSPGCESTAGDLVIPGKVYLLESGGFARGAESDSGGDSRGDGSSSGGGSGRMRVRVTKARPQDLYGIRLSSTMVDDHFMDAYETNIIAAAEQYSHDRCPDAH